MIDTSNYSFSQNPEENETQSLELEKTNNFWRWFIYLSLLFLGGGLSYGWFFLTQKLIPLLEKPVSDYISRPVKLGKIEAVSLTKIRLGETRIDITENENDSAIAEGIEISFNPLQLLGKNIDLGITVINSSIYLQQDKDKSWINLALNKDIKKSLYWSFNVDNIQVKNSDLFVKSNKNLENSVTQLEIPSANISFEKNQSLFEVNGDFIQGGNIQVSGLHKVKENQWLLKINSEDLATNILDNLMILPVDVNSGKVTGDVALEFYNRILKDIQGEVSFNKVNLNLPNIPYELTGSQGRLIFDNKQIKLENINTNLGLINTQVNGFIDKNKQLNIQANTVNPIEIKNVLTSLKLNKNNLDTKGKVTGKIDIFGDIHKPKIAVNISNVGVTEIEKITFDNATANLEIYNHQLSINNLNLLPTIGGEISATGKINLSTKKDDSFTIDWQGKNIEGEKLASIFYQQELPINIGLISGNYNLSGNWQQFNQAKFTGFSTVELAGGKANIENLEINHDTWKGEVRLSGVKLTELPNIDCEKIGCHDSLLNGKFQVSGKNKEINNNKIELVGNFDINFGGGIVNLDNTKISQGNWQTLITAENLLVSELPSINLTSLPIQGGKINANLDVKGNLTNNDEIKIQGKGKVDLPQGIINIDNFTLAEDNFIAETNTVNFPLDNMGKNLRGDVSGRVKVTGNIENITAEKVNLDGDLVFNQGIGIINQPISANFSWNGENLRLNQAVSDGIQAKGIIKYDIEKETVKDIDLDIIGFGIDLQDLSLPSSLNSLKYRGKFDFRGNLQGNFLQPELTGNVNLNNFQIVNLAFSPLKGDITFAVNEGLNLQLNSANEAEKFSLQLDEKNQPQLIDLQIQDTKVKAIKNDETLVINAINIPLEKVTKTWLSYFPADVKKISGNLSGNVNLNLNNYDFTTANIIIEKPTVNHLQGDKLTTQLSREKEIIKIEDGKLNHQKNEYLFVGELQPFGKNPQLKAKVEIKEGDIQNLLNSWQIFELRDISAGLQPRQYGNAKDLYLATPSNNNNSREKIVSSASSSQGEEKSLPSVSSSQGEEKSLPSVSSSQGEEKSLPSVSSSQGEEKSSPSASLSQGEEKSLPSVSSSQGEEKSSPSASLSQGEEKSLPYASLSQGEEKSSPSSASSQGEEKSSPSASSSQGEEKSLPSASLSQGEEKSLPSASLSQGEEKSSPSSASSQGEEKSSPSASSSQGEEKSSPSSASSQGEEKSSPSSASSQGEEKSSPSSSLSQGEEKSSPSASLSQGEEKSLPSASLSQGEEKSSPSSSSSNSQSKPLASIQRNDDSLLDTLAFFRKVEAQLQQVEANRVNATLPSLENLQGKLRGSIDVNLSFQEGIKAEFDFRGDNWLWGKYQGNSLQATGSYDKGLLTLLPVKIQSGDSILSLTGTFQPKKISGEIKLSDFSISQLKQVANLPNVLDINGVINASIAISGSEEKPLAKGNIELNNSSINGTKIDKTTASFGFRNSRLDFLANSNLTENTQPLTLIASLPFQLFPNSLLPENNDFLVRLNLTEDGFNLLDIITNNQLNWLDGEGDINLDIKGKYSQHKNQITDIDTQGIALFKNGVISGKILPDNSITNINGQVFFNFDQLNIPNLTGNFSGGNITISGGLPLINNRFSDDSLNISVDSLALDINSLYLGNAQGFINIANSAIAPEIGGKIKLYNGEIKVTENLNNNTKNLNQSTFINTNFKNLQLILGENISISQPPLLNLKAEGSLNINGALNNLKPEGIINLKGGNLNLFTSQLKLANNYNNIAKFTSENGFEPYLDIQLEGSVTETLRYQLANNSNPNEIRDIANSSLNNAQTIRIKANVKGWSNNLENNIKLSSSPQRNQIEIIALLGGGFFNDFGQGDSNLGLANLASAAFLGSVQGQLQKEFGFDQLRLFPTQIFNTENSTSSFALGAELGLNITDNFSVSITKILTNEQAPSYSMRYRLNDQTILRGSSDFEQDSRGVIEFEHRF